MNASLRGARRRGLHERDDRARGERRVDGVPHAGGGRRRVPAPLPPAAPRGDGHGDGPARRDRRAPDAPDELHPGVCVRSMLPPFSSRLLVLCTNARILGCRTYNATPRAKPHSFFELYPDRRTGSSQV